MLFSIGDVATAFAVPVSTLRYYDEIGLVPAALRRSGVRHYDQAALLRLAYVQLWRLDGMLSIEHTTEVVGSDDREKRNALLRRGRDELAEQISRLSEAHNLLDHALKCTSDDHQSCPVISTYLEDRVATALERLATGGGAPRREAAGPVFRRIVESLGDAVDEHLAGRGVGD